MKKYALLLLVSLMVTSCQQELLNTPEEETPTQNVKKHSGMSRMKFASREQLAERMSYMENMTAEMADTRAIVMPDEYTEGTEAFKSLYDSNREQTLNSLSEGERQSLENDEDDLEYQLADSVIADYHFALMLNANREIECNDTVYKYYENGVAYVPSEFSDELGNIDEDVAQISPEESAGTTTDMGGHVKFIVPDNKMVALQENFTDYDPESGDGGGTLYSPKNGPMKLQSGFELPESKIREVNFDGGGDGTWIHNAFHGLFGLFGKDILAIQKFSDNRRMVLSFYHLNYVVYTHIGSSVRMQKKVLGIWWNIKAEQMSHGWETICVDYQMPGILTEYFGRNQDGTPAIPSTMPKRPDFPFKDNSEIFLHIPFLNIDFTNRNMNDLFWKACNIAWNKIPEEMKVTWHKDKIGLFSYEGPHLYIFSGPMRQEAYDKRSMSSDVYAKAFPCSFEFTFDLSGGFKLKGIRFDLNDHVDIDCGVVYGAVKYRGEWLGARIVKYHKDSK